MGLYGRQSDDATRTGSAKSRLAALLCSSCSSTLVEFSAASACISNPCVILLSPSSLSSKALLQNPPRMLSGDEPSSIYMPDVCPSWKGACLPARSPAMENVDIAILGQARAHGRRFVVVLPVHGGRKQGLSCSPHPPPPLVPCPPTNWLQVEGTGFLFYFAGLRLVWVYARGHGPGAKC